jgi:hypothetical protein
MENHLILDFTFNVWDNSFTFLSIILSSVVAFFIFKLSQKLSAHDKYKHEQNIIKQLENISIYSKILLADIKKYTPHRSDSTNNTYYKQAGEIYTIIPEFGVQVILRPDDEKIPVGLIPFAWIAYIREYDSEDNSPIVVCKFKGIKWYKKFKSPFKEINYVYRNTKYQEAIDPKSFLYSSINTSK